MDKKIWKKLQIVIDNKYEEPVSEILNSFKKDGLLIEKVKDKISIIQYFPLEEFTVELIDGINSRLETLKNFFLDFRFKIELDEIEEENWAENWKENFKPLRIGNKIIIYPSWEKPKFKKGDILIQMDPGGAFGTGLHETTKLCSSIIENMVDERKFDRMVDIGCGTGILSFIASELGVKEVIATDIDEHAIKITEENSKINGIDNVKIIHSDLIKKLPESVIKDGFDLVVANILLDKVIRLIPDMVKLVKENGTFVLSGITVDQISIVRDIIEKEKLKFISEHKMNEWAVVVGKKI